jgi:hypothetical protein
MARCPAPHDRCAARSPHLTARVRDRERILWLTLAFALASAGPLAPRIVRAQQPVAASPQWEGRLDAVLAPRGGAMVGAGLNLRAGWYARVGASVSAGAVQRADAWEARQRVDATARFLFDPFGESRRGFYAGAGLAAERRADGDVRGLLLGIMGFEGATTGRVVPALELQLGGGVRLGLVLRERRRQGR